MRAASSVLLVPHEFETRADAPFDIDCPPLEAHSAVCIGLTIEWRHQDTLKAYALRHTLPDEHARAQRFAREDDSLRNLLGRALLRRAAAHYGGMDPLQTIRVSTWGKPELTGCSVGCNVSHAGNQLWVAVSRHPHVGIDIGSARAPQEYRDLTAGFHPDELASLRKASDIKAATMRCWSRKEAISKATGRGMSLPLRAYAVECDTRPSDWLRFPPPDSRLENWTTVDLPVGKDYIGALAIEGRVEKAEIVRVTLAG